MISWVSCSSMRLSHFFCTSVHGCAAENALHRRPDPQIEGRQSIAKRGLPHKADDGRGDIFVLGVGPGAAEIGVRVAERVQFQPERFQLGPREIARALHDEGQRRDLVDVAAHEGGKAVEKILRLLPGAIAVRHGDDLIRMIGDRDKEGRAAVRIPVENAAEGRALL